MDLPFRTIGAGVVVSGLVPTFLGPHPGLDNTITRVAAGVYQFVLSEPTPLGSLVLSSSSILIASFATDDSYTLTQVSDDTIQIASNATGVLADIDYGFSLLAILPN